MSFEDGALKGQASDRNELLKQQRMAAMFGNRQIEEGSSTPVNRAVFPIGEKVNLPIELIDEHPDNETVFNMDFIAELAEVMADGYYGAIEVYQKDDGRYEILSGHRRFRARKLNGEKTIPAIISEKPSEIERAKRLILSNIHNRVLTPLDYARCIEYYIDHVLVPSGFKGDKTKECSKVFMKSTTHIKRYLALNKMIPEIKELLITTTFPFTALDGARTFNIEEQKALLDEIQKFKKENPDTEISELYIKQIIHQINLKKGKVSNAPVPAEPMVHDGPNLNPPAYKEERTESVKHIQPPVEFAASPINNPASNRNTEVYIGTEEEESAVLFETVLEAYYSQLCNLNMENYNTKNKEQILVLICKMQDKLKYYENIFS